jgi:hypothetical protein
VISKRLRLILIAIALVAIWTSVPCEADETKTLILIIDHDSRGFTYRVDGNNTGAEFLNYLEKHKSDWPSEKTKVILLVHEQATLAMIDNSRGMIIKAGYEPPRVFHFNKDKRLMVEITFLPGITFSAKGPS